jgi:hypothetical protein
VAALLRATRVESRRRICGHGNLRRERSAALRSDTPPVLSVSRSLRYWNQTVIVTGLLLQGVLLGYVFVENFQARPGT